MLPNNLVSYEQLGLGLHNQELNFQIMYIYVAEHTMMTIFTYGNKLTHIYQSQFSSFIQSLSPLDYPEPITSHLPISYQAQISQALTIVCKFQTTTIHQIKFVWTLELMYLQHNSRIRPPVGL